MKKSHIKNPKLYYMLAAPMFFYSFYIILMVFHKNRLFSAANIGILIAEITLFSVFIITPIFYLKKMEAKKALQFFLTPLFVFFIYKNVLDYYKIDIDNVDFLINKQKYEKTIKNSTPIRNEKNNKLVIVEIESYYADSKRFLIYDESDAISNEKNEFYGIGYNYATHQDGTKFHSSDFSVVLKKYGDHTYIADVCPEC